MSMDLDSLRGRWQDAGRRAEARLGFDADALRKALDARTQRAFRRHSGWLLASLLIGASVLALLLAFLARHLDDWRYALMAGGLLALAGAEFVVDLRQFLALRALAPDAPLLTVRSTLDALRARRLQMAKWIALTAVLLWWPALLVLLKGLAGIDALRFIPARVVWANLALGLACIPLGLWLSAAIARRFEGSLGYRRFQLEAGGDILKRAEDAFAAREELEA
jgi:hypothetical protein